MILWFYDLVQRETAIQTADAIQARLFCQMRDSLTWVVGNADPLVQKRELKEGSLCPEWVFSPLTKTKFYLVGDFLVFVLLFYVSLPYIHLYKDIFTFWSHWDPMLPLSINWIIFPSICIRGIALSHTSSDFLPKLSQFKPLFNFPK